MSPLHIDKIPITIFNATLARYPDTAPSTLADLDTLRYETIPAKFTLTGEKAKGEKFLGKGDVERLVEWKLKHGTYRPALMGLVQSNPADVVKSTTSEAFAAYAKNGDAMGALKILIKLRGIGPATASLLLSVFKPDEVPFFSDELFRWTHWNSPGKIEYGWQRGIKYTVTEYKEILASVEEVRERLGVKAVDVEKVAYVLGKEGVELGVGAGSEEGAEVVAGDKIDENRERDKRVAEAAAKRGTEKIAKEAMSEDANEAAGEEKEHDKKEKTEEKPKRRGISKEQAPKDERAGIMKRGSKRKAEKKAPAEGTRRSTRRKI